MRRLVGIFVLLLLGSGTSADVQQRLVLSTIEGTPNGVIGAAVLKAAYGKLGIDLDIYYTSGKRSLLVAASGSVDGEVLRVGTVSEMHPTLIRIGVPIHTLEVSAFSKRSNAPKQRVEDLPYLRVGHLRGAVLPEDVTRHLSDVWRANSNRELFKLLMADKLDAVLTSTVTEAVTIRQLGIEEGEIVGQPIGRENLYHFLHKKHADLVPEITTVLEQMAASGELDAIITALTEELLGGKFPVHAGNVE
ncbi:substrate-binding periplasmic protein [Roseibium salinum]|uniref:substrate-binding periplasmic protein n=1 Tax=Roseibium salinum TaxID=1604349 RepID=UPI003611DF86